MVGQVLIITGDLAEARQLLRACDALGVGAQVVASSEEAVTSLRSVSADLVIGDRSAIRELATLRPGVPVMVIAAPTDSDQMIDAIRRGAIDCVLRPLRETDLTRRIGDALRVAAQSEAASPASSREARRPSAVVRIVGQSPAMQEVYRQIGLFAPQPITVLITGESGTGKELVAQALAEHSPRADKPFLVINCAAIPETLLESELFGHEKGAFTGADRRRIGRFEACDGGTLFLDEVGDLPPATQVKLLRVLQSGAFQRLGGNRTITSDVRIIAATHQPLLELIEQKRFREDLYYRLKVAMIQMPPLRQREVDAVLLAHYFVDRIGGQMGSEVRAFAPEAVAALLAYSWPGNVRELENAIRSALAMARGRVLRLEFLPESIRRATHKPAAADALESTADTAPLAMAERLAQAWVAQTPPGNQKLMAWGIGQLENAMIRAALNLEEGSQKRAAARLGISRTTLRQKMRTHGIRVVSAADPA